LELTIFTIQNPSNSQILRYAQYLLGIQYSLTLPNKYMVVRETNVLKRLYNLHYLLIIVGY